MIQNLYFVYIHNSHFIVLYVFYYFINFLITYKFLGHRFVKWDQQRRISRFLHQVCKLHLLKMLNQWVLLIDQIVMFKFTTLIGKIIHLLVWMVINVVLENYSIIEPMNMHCLKHLFSSTNILVFYYFQFMVL